MKKILAKLGFVSTSMMLSLVTVAHALGGDQGVELKTQLSAAQKLINELSLPIGAFFIFVAVLMVGFSIIKNRDNADERGKAMESLLWLAIGAFIIGGALIIAGALGGVGNVTISNV